MLFVSLKVKKKQENFNGKEGILASKGKQKYAQQGIQAAHRILASKVGILSEGGIQASKRKELVFVCEAFLFSFA